MYPPRHSEDTMRRDQRSAAFPQNTDGPTVENGGGSLENFAFFEIEMGSVAQACGVALGT